MPPTDMPNRGPRPSEKNQLLMMKKFLFPLLLLPVLMGLASCATEKPSKQVITVSIEPLRFLTEQLAGDKFEVRTVMPDGANPETYNPTMQQMQLLAESTAYIRVGTLGFEKTQMRMITENCPHLYVVNAAEKTPEITLCGHDGHKEEIDPHTWMAPRNMNIMALNICKALAHIDYKNAEFYDQNLTNFLHYSDSLNLIIAQRLDTLPSRTFLINHPSLGHFAMQYRLQQLSVEHDGKEASAEQMADLIDECRRDSVRIILVQEQHSDRAVNAIARELNLRPLKINPLRYEWDEEILRISELFCQ